MKINRIHQIHELLKEVHSISLDELCTTFNVSKNTIRRDIAELENNGIIQKVYGGVVLAEQNESSPEPFSFREIRNADAKKQVAQIAASLVNEGDVIYIDSGTTTMHMIPFLAKMHRLTIVTSNLHVLNAAANYNHLNTISTGGSLYVPSKAFVGPSVLAGLQNYNFSKIFLASTGVSIEHGATNASPLECEIKQNLVKQNIPRFLLVDSSKFDKSSLMTYCQLSDIDGIITEKAPSEAYLTYFRQHDVQILTHPVSSHDR